ncbi:UTRA domain-containing protein [Roseinatronobacter sp. S2]|uniref:UTRA domain-containing protein n=1 Tax=Roseinatronobacter sp. S2 TaxID=3035471 RepID=UPI00240F6695|nr:UTRA domain-containing protein [Roseinatronobacter sp. S2]WFE74725.1 UTRA domain-containing protein [Roseinatronobacter sp. S2]
MHDDHSQTSGATGLVSLQRNDSVPLFTQLKQSLLVAIRDGQFAPGAPLPTETQLCDMYDVSRITVRRAVTELQNEGVLEKRHGKGTFVTVQRIETSLMTLNGFSESYSARGVEHHSQLLEHYEGIADAKLAQALNIVKGAPVLHVKRLISTQTGPLTVDVSQFPAEMFPGLADLLQDDVSIYGLLRSNFDKQVVHVHRSINVKLAGLKETRILACNPGEPLFDMEKIVYDADRRALQRSRLLTPCNRITLTIDV